MASQKCRFSQGPTTLPVASYTTALPEQVAGATWDGGPSSIGVRLELLHLAGKKNGRLFAPLHTRHRTFAKTGSG
jgi:hypothetical protein